MHFHGKKPPKSSLPRSLSPRRRGAGVQNFLNFLDSRFHGNDGKGRSPTFYEFINLSRGFCKYPHVFTTEAQRTRRGLCFFVYPASSSGTNKNSSLCPLCLCGEPTFVTAIVKSNTYPGDGDDDSFAVGSRIVKVVPFPRTLSTSMMPLWLLIMS